MKKLFFVVLAVLALANSGFSQGCSPTAVISMPSTKDGVGQFCFETPCAITQINSWNMTRLYINGVDFTNKWADGPMLPPPINGKYFIEYNAAYAWSHFEALGSCGIVTTPAPSDGPEITPVVMTPAVTPFDEPTPTQSTIVEPVIDRIVPVTGPIGTRVTISGSGYAAAGNTIVFRNAMLDGIWESRIDAGSTDGKTLMFSVPEYLNPICAYEPDGGCVAVVMNTTPGAYHVFVIVGSSTSNAAAFTVTDSMTPEPVVPTPVITPAPTFIGMTPTPSPTPRPVNTPVVTAAPPAITIPPVPTTPGPTEAPSSVEPPTNVIATVNTCTSPNVHSIRWNASTSIGIVSYKIHLSCTSGGPYSLFTAYTVTAASATYTYSYNPAASSCYYYVVSTVDSDGIESAYSAQALIAISACPPPTPVAPVVTPSSDICTSCIIPDPPVNYTPDPTYAPTPLGTPAPTVPARPGLVSITTSRNVIKMCETFTTPVYVNTGTQAVAAYGITITYNSSIMTPNECNGASAVTPGVDGFITATNISTPGSIRIAGVDAIGKGPGTALHLLSISWKAIPFNTGYSSWWGYFGTSKITLAVDQLIDTSSLTIGTPGGMSVDIVFYSGDTPPPSPE